MAIDWYASYSKYVTSFPSKISLVIPTNSEPPPASGATTEECGVNVQLVIRQQDTIIMIVTGKVMRIGHVMERVMVNCV